VQSLVYQRSLFQILGVEVIVLGVLCNEVDVDRVTVTQSKTVAVDQCGYGVLRIELKISVEICF
jgi:hypothetical protein